MKEKSNLNIADLIINGSNDTLVIQEMEKVLHDNTVGRTPVSDYTTQCSLVVSKEEYGKITGSLKD